MAGDTGSAAATAGAGEYRHSDIVHDLPPAKLVDRLDSLTEQCRGKRVIHLEVADSRFRDELYRAGRWLRARRAEAATELVGLDADPASVQRAQAQGYTAHAVDCTDPAAIEALGIEPADIVVAGEVIQHLDAPDAYLNAIGSLCRYDGQFIVTTPNATGLGTLAPPLLRGVELNHPDHLVMFSWRTRTELMRRHGWQPAQTYGYTPTARDRVYRSRLEWIAVVAMPARSATRNMSPNASVLPTPEEAESWRHRPVGGPAAPNPIKN